MKKYAYKKAFLLFKKSPLSLNKTKKIGRLKTASNKKLMIFSKKPKNQNNKISYFGAQRGMQIEKPFNPIQKIQIIRIWMKV
jgi:hypothetical protein